MGLETGGHVSVYLLSGPVDMKNKEITGMTFLLEVDEVITISGTPSWAGVRVSGISLSVG